MSTLQRFYVLLSILAFISAACVFLIARLFKSGRIYQQGLDKMEHATEAIVELGDDLKELVRLKEREHDRLEAGINRVDARLDRLEQRLPPGSRP